MIHDTRNWYERSVFRNERPKIKKESHCLRSSLLEKGPAEDDLKEKLESELKLPAFLENGLIPSLKIGKRASQYAGLRICLCSDGNVAVLYDAIDIE
jgi:hypothetical protein